MLFSEFSQCLKTDVSSEKCDCCWW